MTTTMRWSWGQYIKVFPAVNVIVVIIASGMDYDEIATQLSATFIDPDHPLAENPSGVTKLQEAIVVAAASPHAWQTGPLPESARQIIGKDIRV